MANARDLLNRKNSVTNTRKITRTMELVASSKAKKAQDAAEASRPYSEALARLVTSLAENAGEDASHDLMEQRPVKKVVLLVATSDRGLCGAFNANVVKHAVERIEAHQADGHDLEVVTLGKKGYSTLRFFGFEPSGSESGIIDKPQYAQAQAIIEPLMDRFLSGDVDMVEVVYPRFVNVARQEPSHMTLLPAGGADEVESTTEEVSEDEINLDFLYEPDANTLLQVLIPQTVKTAFFSVLLQTSAGEHNARRVAMKNATDAANDLIKNLNRSYNRARQTKITQEIAEIVGAVEAMS